MKLSTIKYDLFIILLPGYGLTLGKTMIDSTSAQLICGPHNVVSINAFTLFPLPFLGYGNEIENLYTVQASVSIVSSMDITYS